MSVVKIGNKQLLEQLQAKLTLRLGRRPTQQEVLDLCVRLGLQNIENLVDLMEIFPILNISKVNDILKERDKHKDIPYLIDEDLLAKDDADIYK